MGVKCCSASENSNRKARTQAKVNLAPTEDEISFPSYSSSNDKLFNDLEVTYNLFSKIAFGDFVALLIKFSLDNATLEENNLSVPVISKNQAFYRSPISIDVYQSFIEQKILKRPELYELCGKNELVGQGFTSLNLEMYKGLNIKMNQYFGDKNPERIIKGYLFPFGLLYCKSTNIEKIKFFFDLFKNENNQFVPSSDLDEFLFSLFILPSYAILSARRKLGMGGVYKISELPDEEMKKVLDTSEFKDSKYLVTVFNSEFFENGKKKAFTYNEFKDKFRLKNEGFGWIFNPKGIRGSLEKNNV